MTTSPKITPHRLIPKLTPQPWQGRTKPPTLREMNKWMRENHKALLMLAENNCIKLTGKPRL